MAGYKKPKVRQHRQAETKKLNELDKTKNPMDAWKAFDDMEKKCQ